MAEIPAFARTWLEQAEADLAAAEDSVKAGHFEWACFQSQQAGEKGLKAWLYARGKTAIVTHSLRRLLRELQALEPGWDRLKKEAKLLDDCYIPTRYPNGLDEELPPARYYEREDAEECLRCARSILDPVRRSFGS